MKNSNKNYIVHFAPGTTFKGKITSKSNIYLSGKIYGEIQTPADIYLLKDSELEANIKAKNTQIMGMIKGSLEIDKTIIVNSEGKIFGQISCDSLKLMEGAVYSGQLLVENEKN